MHGLDKVAHVLHLSGFASVRCIGRPAFPTVDGYLAPGPASVGWVPGSAPSALDGLLSKTDDDTERQLVCTRLLTPLLS